MHPDAVTAYFDYESEDIRATIPNRAFFMADADFRNVTIELRRIAIKKKHMLTTTGGDILTCTIGVCT